jgi:hypothetical protein
MRQISLLTTVAQNHNTWEKELSDPTSFGSRHHCPHRNFEQLFLQCIADEQSLVGFALKGQSFKINRVLFNV